MGTLLGCIYVEVIYELKRQSERAYPCDEQGDEEEERHFGVSECGSVCFHGCSVIVLGDGRLRPRCHGRDFRSGAQRC